MSKKSTVRLESDTLALDWYFSASHESKRGTAQSQITNHESTITDASLVWRFCTQKCQSAAFIHSTESSITLSNIIFPFFRLFSIHRSRIRFSICLCSSVCCAIDIPTWKLFSLLSSHLTSFNAYRSIHRGLQPLLRRPDNTDARHLPSWSTPPWLDPRYPLIATLGRSRHNFDRYLVLIVYVCT